MKVDDYKYFKEIYKDEVQLDIKKHAAKSELPWFVRTVQKHPYAGNI